MRLDTVDIDNWLGDDGYEFRPRLRDNVQMVDRHLGPRMALDEDAPELDEDYGIDCD